ncbi:transport ATPase [Natronorubrum sulfidifaciens JCM 14089]|uniref:Transport ATPase n=1 Tax=Natronorubrum sulfidifaciens JCM 14089 TaxID=1230460 RepID=L9WIZ6_9EURY|nr:transport ATPase [Natronorubrum sulfidifaciens JCM 14089]
MLKAGILEIADVFVVNKADMDGADMTVKELHEMVTMNDPTPMSGHHGPDAMATSGGIDDTTDEQAAETWTPPIVETIATSGDGVPEFLDTVDDHVTWLVDTGERAANQRSRYADEIRTLLREDTSALLEAELEARGGLETYVDSVVDAETDPYTVAAEFLEPLETCLRERTSTDGQTEPTAKRVE